MKVKSQLKYLRIAPRKVRLTADMIRGKKVEDAQTTLRFTIKKSANPLLKLLNTAVSDAKNNFQLDPTNLIISEIKVDGGPMLKRWRARSRGMVAPIQKKTSHITVVLDEIETGKRIKKEEVKKEVKTVKEEKPKVKRPVAETEKPKSTKGLKKIFRRKSI